MPRPAPYGFNRSFINVSIPLTAGLNVTTQFTLLLSHALAAKFTIERVKAIWTIAATGAAASRTLNVRKGNATGTVVATKALVLADGTQGAVVDVPVTAANADYDDPDTLTVEIAAGGTVFTAGEVTLHIQLRQRSQRAG